MAIARHEFLVWLSGLEEAFACVDVLLMFRRSCLAELVSLSFGDGEFGIMARRTSMLLLL